MGSSGTYGNVDFFGLDEFGQPAGMHGAFGAAAGAGLATGTAIAIRKYATASPQLQKYSELVGAAVGAAAGGVMAVFGRMRAAGWSAIAAAGVSGVLRQWENSTQTYRAVAPFSGHGLREYTMEPRTAFQGLGMVTTEPRTAFQGLNGRRPTFVGPPSLQGDAGFAANAPARHVQLVGGPPMSQLSSLYGATHFSKN